MNSPKKTAARIKSYFAATVDAAIAQARAEMGTDALLLNTRKVAETEGQAAGYEVVFGLGDVATTVAPLTLPVARRRESEAQPRIPAKSQEIMQRVAQRFASSAATAAAPAPQPQHDELADEITKLHAQIDEIRSLLMRSSAQQITIGRTVPELADVYARLMESGVDAGLSKDIVDRLEASMATDAFFVRLGKDEAAKATSNRWKQLRFDSERLESFVRSELQRRVPIEPLLGGDQEKGAVVIMVGPTGAGKTTSIMKLSASKQASGRKVRILTLDSSRGGQTLLHSFATNLGIAFTPVQSIHGLAAMAAQSPNDLVFIDTPGYSMQADRNAELAAEAFTKIENLEVHLVVPGYMKSTDLRRSTQKYGVFGASRMIVTKLDETDTYGSVFSEAARAQLALSFLANGPGIEDIRAATTEDLMALAFEKPAARAHCA